MVLQQLIISEIISFFNICRVISEALVQSKRCLKCAALVPCDLDGIPVLRAHGEATRPRPGLCQLLRQFLICLGGGG